MNVKNKKLFLLDFLQKNNIANEEILYMGDDMPDMECMKIAGVASCPLDAVPDIRAIADYISPFTGGKGCVRDVIEKVMKLNGDWNSDANIAST
jgi:3-deoxy-D-manno-octulosonate 8-phosphate phosphatase (KDO 8-P phosphatase)